MATTTRIDQTPVRMSTQITQDRQTARTDFGSRLKDGMSSAAGVVASGAAVAAPIVPGGAVITAAVTGANVVGGSLSSGQRVGVGASRAYGSGSPGTTGTATSASGNSVNVAAGDDNYAKGIDLLNRQQAANMEYLSLQGQMQNESQKFSTISNVMKVRSDTAKNSIQNVK